MPSTSAYSACAITVGGPPPSCFMNGSPTEPGFTINVPWCCRTIGRCVCPPAITVAAWPRTISSTVGDGVVTSRSSMFERGVPW